MTQKKYFALYFVLVLTSSGYCATDLYLPSLPAITEHFAIPQTKAKQTVSIYLLSFSLAPLVFGPLSDYLGRKKVILIGLAIAILATIPCCMAKSIQWLLFPRFIQGMGTGAVLIASRAVLPDLFQGRDLAKGISLMTMLRPFIVALAPAVGGYIQRFFGWQAVFMFLLMYFCLLLCGLQFMPESLNKHNVSTTNFRQYFVDYKNLLLNKKFMLYGFGNIVPSFGIFAYFTASPFIYANIANLSAEKYGVIAIFLGLGIVISSYINIQLIHRLKLINIILLGSFLMLFSGLLMLQLHFLHYQNMWSLLIPSMCFFACIPLIMSNAVALGLSNVTEKYGAATALLTTLQFLSGAVGSYVFAYTPNTSLLPLGICFTICASLCLSIYILDLKFLKDEEKLCTLKQKLS